MSKCLYFLPTELGLLENCANCKRWNCHKCENEELLKKHYEESKVFDYYDRMMRDNKGIRGPL